MNTRTLTIEIDRKWKWIARDKDGDVTMFTHEPRRLKRYFPMWGNRKPGVGEVARMAAIIHLPDEPDWRKTLRKLEG